jgi:pyruvate dehydrogenase E1 component
MPEGKLRAFLDRVPFNARGTRRFEAPVVAVPDELPTPKQAALSTQQGFGLILSELARSDEALAERIVTTSPDVTVSTNLGGWVNRRGLFARQEMRDLFKSERIPSTIARGLDALNYACYQDARFILVATPSGVTLAPEGGAHQSISSPLIGLAQDGLAAFEPAYVDELSVILRWAFAYMQKNGEGEPNERSWLRDETGGSVYLRLSTRTLDQPQRAMTPALAEDVVDGAYWMRKPGPNAQVVVAYTGAMAPEAIEAVGLMAEDRRDVGLLAITSADRLNAGWTAAQRARERGLVHARSHIERLLGEVPAHCGLVTVIDGHPATLGWLGSVMGHRTRSLGVEHFGQTGTLQDLYRHYGIDAQGIIQAAQAIAPGRPIRHLRAMG